MGVVAEDLDRDGLIDIFHTNFLNEPNTLHKNVGKGIFDDVTQALGLDASSRPMTGFGAAGLDADNDGRLDVFVANGHVDDRPWANHPMAQTPQLYLSRAKKGKENEGQKEQASAEGTTYELASVSASPYLARKVVGRGLAAGDLDNDGRTDVIIVHRDVPAVFLRNVAPSSAHWLSVRLRGSKTSVPVGASVTCRARGITTRRWVTSGTSYLAANDPRLAFGLGRARTVDRLEIEWPSGRVQAWENLSSDRFLAIREGENPVEIGGAIPAPRR
jgi:hypothetical protein